MSRIFISHSGANNAAALAISAWLVREGWADHFLDIAAEGDLAPGVRWQEALKSATHRCEAVVVLISPAWLASHWCLTEFLVAKQLGKRIFGVVIEATPIASIPAEMTAEWQLCDLVNGEERETFDVRLDPLVPPASIAFSTPGLRRLKQGLRKAGLDPSTFEWPPAADPQRPPYCGLKPLDVDDCAIFFGRDAPIVRGLDELRTMRETGVERLLVVLGASGSGKSSFLRAGLWPRLARDDIHFIPLPIIRPQRGVITGEAGLVAALEGGLRRFGIVRTRLALARSLEQPDGLAAVLREIQVAAGGAVASAEASAPGAPCIVLSIDQAEELLGAEGRAEATKFLRLLESVFSEPADINAAGRAARRLVLGVLTIRSDSFATLQSQAELANVPVRPFNLRALSPSEYRSVIEGPARRATEASRPLRIDPQLTERLLQESAGTDALPLLAFILERLYRECGADGDLRLEEYEALGGLRGAIVSTVEGAFSEPTREPRVPQDEAARERLLRDAFIPWLAVIDPDTGQRKRRVARWSEIPAESQPLMERLIGTRLIVRDRDDGPDAAPGEATVEVAHEALLRQWPLLTSWLDEQSEQLQMLEAVRRAAAEWQRRGRSRDWLIHLDARLHAAAAIAEQPRYKQLLGEEGNAYLLACRELDDANRAERERQQREVAAAQERTALEQRRTAKAQRFGRWLIAAVAGLVLVAAIGVVIEARSVSRQTSQVLVANAKQASADGAEARALRFAILAARSSTLGPSVPQARPVLAGLLADSRLEITLPHDRPVQDAVYSGDGKWIATLTSRFRVQIWNASTGEPAGPATQVNDLEPSDIFAISNDGRYLALNGSSGVQIWDAKAGKTVGSKLGIETNVLSAMFSPDGRWLAVNEWERASLWEVETSRSQQFSTAQGALEVDHLMFGQNGLVALSWDDGGRVQTWSVQANGFATPVGKPIESHAPVQQAAIGRDLGTLAIIAKGGDTSFWDVPSGASKFQFSAAAVGEGASDAVFSFDGSAALISCDCGQTLWIPLKANTHTKAINHRGNFAPVLAPAGQQLAALVSDKDVRFWSNSEAAESEPFRHRTAVTSVSLSPDGAHLLTSDADGAYVWRTHRRIDLTAIETFVPAAAFSPDGRRLAMSFQYSGNNWGYVAMMNVETRRLIAEPSRLSDLVFSVAFSPDGSRFVTAGNEVLMWDGKTGAQLKQRIAAPELAQEVSFSADGSRLLIEGGEETWLVDARTGARLGAPIHHSVLASSKLSTDGKWLASADGKSVSVRDALTGVLQGKAMEHSEDVSDIELSADARLVATVTERGSATLWDRVTGKQVMSLNARDDRTDVAYVRFSPPDSLAVVSTEGLLRLWRLGEEPRLEWTVDQGGSPLPAEFAANAELIFSGSDRQAQLWDAIAAERLSSTPEEKDGLDGVTPSPDGRHALVVGSNGAGTNLWTVSDVLFASSEQATRIACREHLRGGSLITPADVDAAPILKGRVGEDVCGRL